jgi:hypothetical protein
MSLLRPTIIYDCGGVKFPSAGLAAACSYFKDNFQRGLLLSACRRGHNACT